MIFIDGFAVDAALKEVHNQSNKPTTHPLERGATATDHIILNPGDLLIEGIISNAPSGRVASIRLREEGKPSDNARKKFDALMAAPKAITVIASKTYTNMVMTNISIPFDKDTGDALRFTAMFQVMTFIDNQRQFVEVATPGAARRDVRGNKPAKKPPETPADTKADRNSSLLWKLTH